MAVAVAAAVSPAPERRRGKPVALFLLLPVLLLGGAWGLAKAGVLPVGKWAGKSKSAQKALGALGLVSKKNKHDKKVATTHVAEKAPPPEPETAPAVAAAAAPPKPAAPPQDNTGKVAAILATMDGARVAALLAKMPDAEAAPLLLKMKPRLAGEILAALPPTRAVVLTRYLRRAPGKSPGA